MAVEISYRGDNDTRRARKDAAVWLGFKRARILFRMCKQAKTYADLDQFDLWCNFAGFSGQPVRALIEHYHGFAALEEWRKTKGPVELPIGSSVN